MIEIWMKNHLGMVHTHGYLFLTFWLFSKFKKHILPTFTLAPLLTYPDIKLRSLGQVTA